MCVRPETLESKRISRRFFHPLRTGAGEFFHREAMVLRLVDAEGRIGYGEVAPWPGFPCETIDAAEVKLAEISVTTDLSGLSAAGYPCLAAGLGAARMWSSESLGARQVAVPCAGLLRDVTDHEAALAKADAGFRTLKVKVGRERVRDEQREVSRLIKSLAIHPDVALRLDANGALDAGTTAAWCDFLSEYPEVEWLEQPMAPGAESVLRDIAEKSGVSDRIALDESICGGAGLPTDWPGVLAVKPALVGDPVAWRRHREAYPRVAYASVFETAFGRQFALAMAAEDRRADFAAGFDTLGVFDDARDQHKPGPVASTLAREPAFWESVWAAL